MINLEAARRLIQAVDQSPELKSFLEWRKKNEATESEELTASVRHPDVNDLFDKLHLPYPVPAEFGSYFKDSYGVDWQADSAYLWIKGKDEPRLVELGPHEQSEYLYFKVRGLGYLIGSDHNPAIGRILF